MVLRIRIAAVLACALAICLVTPASAQDAPTPVPRAGDSALWRVSFLVNDLEAARAVWGEALGFTLVAQKRITVDDPRMSALYGIGEIESVELLVFRSGNTALGNIGFMRPDNGVSEAGGRLSAGVAGMFILTTDMDAQGGRRTAVGRRADYRSAGKRG